MCFCLAVPVKECRLRSAGWSGELAGDEADEVSARPAALGSGEHRIGVVEVLTDVQRRVNARLQELGMEERIVRKEDLPGPHEGRHLLQARQVAVDG